ncbi:MAG: peptide deformylase, partial [Clostridiales bacterium]|nr:peptide deformylase [Clostridiales bacterium]
MALRRIRLYNDELLRKKSKPVKAIDQKILTLLDDMKETMTAANGMGIAAPQVGVLKRMVIVEMEEKLYELINPVIVEAEGSQARTEGCLSVPGKNGTVERPARVKVQALDRGGNETVLEGEDLFAVVLCHEIDHLDGIL